MENKRRVALVTGGAKRVGRAIVEKLAANGFDIAFTYHSSADDAADLARQLTSQSVRAVPIQADHTTDSAAAVADEVKKNFDRLDLLVNSASLYEPTAFKDPASSLDQQLFNIHFHQPLALCRQLAPLLRASHGHIVNMVDLLAEKPWPEYLVYCASKAALANLTLSLARELAPEVNVNAIAPGVVEWPEGFPDDLKTNYLKRVPLARAGTPEEVARLVHFLCTDGGYITGQIIRLDGGRSIT